MTFAAVLVGRTQIGAAVKFVTVLPLRTSLWVVWITDLYAGVVFTALVTFAAFIISAAEGTESLSTPEVAISVVRTVGIHTASDVLTYSCEWVTNLPFSAAVWII